MINFKITNLGDGSLSLEKPSGKTMSLKLGEILRADVMDILPSGEVTLKVKGDIVTAKTEVPLDKGATAFFKVTGQPAEGGELKLQFVGYPDEPGQPAGALPAPDLKGETLNKLIQDLSGEMAGSTGRANPETITNLIKALPPDIASLPKDLKVRIQNLLTSSLKSTGQSIQSRLDSLLTQLPDTLKDHPLVESIKKDLIINIEKMLGPSLKTALQNTGVALEAKLKTAVAGLLMQQMEQDASRPEPSPSYSPAQHGERADANLKAVLTGGLLQQQEHSSEGIAAELPSHAGSPVQQAEKNADRPAQVKPEQGAAHADARTPELPSVKGDLKAALLELRDFIADKKGGAADNVSARMPAAASQAAHDSAQAQKLHENINGLLKDIETFQALSKTTDSFYTFLPLNWKELREGEISFKRGQGNAGVRSSYSCRLNLDLGEFGSLSVMVLMYNKDFFVSFKTEKADLRSTLNANLDELKDTFREKGMSLKAVNNLDKDDHSFEQMEKLASSERIINIKA